MASIYQLGEGFDTLWALIEEGEIPEEAIVDAFDVAKEDLADKLEGYCKFLKNLEADIAGLKAEETRLKTRRQVLENTAKKAKEAMRDAMKKAGEKKMPCGLNPKSTAEDYKKAIAYAKNLREERNRTTYAETLMSEAEHDTQGGS